MLLLLGVLLFTCTIENKYFEATKQFFFLFFSYKNIDIIMVSLTIQHSTMQHLPGTLKSCVQLLQENQAHIYSRLPTVHA